MTEYPMQPSVGTLGDPVSPEQPGGELKIFRLEPNARPDDPRWDNAPNHGAIRVRAFSAADARIVAAEAEVDFLDIKAKPGDGTTTNFASAFRDDKLYHVTLEEEEEGVLGPRGVIDDT
ncbi:MAG: hypothetical protein ACSHXI_12120 [Hoeflea sp.]|uniref:hypothetical protein n=1 Tax=Hoeflea sp. TaxID=1940281 RepID=UPI003EF57AE1